MADKREGRERAKKKVESRAEKKVEKNKYKLEDKIVKSNKLKGIDREAETR